MSGYNKDNSKNQKEKKIEKVAETGINRAQNSVLHPLQKELEKAISDEIVVWMLAVEMLTLNWIAGFKSRIIPIMYERCGTF